MKEEPQLHSSIVAMISLASGIASNHPAMGQCQLERLRNAGIPQHQLDTVVEIARHIRDEATEKLDATFDEAYKGHIPTVAADENEVQSCDCSVTPSGQSCC